MARRQLLRSSSSTAVGLLCGTHSRALSGSSSSSTCSRRQRLDASSDAITLQSRVVGAQAPGEAPSAPRQPSSASNWAGHGNTRARLLSTIGGVCGSSPTSYAQLQTARERAGPLSCSLASSAQGAFLHTRRSFASQGDQKITASILTPFQTHKFEPPPMQIETSAEELSNMFRAMNIIRRTEITADMLYKQQLVRGFCHLYDGQEAVAIGMEAALTYEDSVITAYRQHGTFIGRGGTPYEVFCELMGRTPGSAMGKGGSMHMYHLPHNYYGGWGIVGTSPPLGTGIALAQKIEKQDKITVAIFGDGSANQGQVYEAFNMAGLWKLPIIFAVENNHYGMGTSEARASAQTTFYDRVPYMPGIKVDGMDVFAVKQATRYARKHAAEKGPIILEFDTYRYHGHSMSDPGSTYRDRSEIQDMRHSRDCITRLRQLILNENIASEDELKAIEKEVRASVDDDAQRARNAPMPDDSELWTHTYRNDSKITQYGVNRRETAVQMK